MRRVSNLIEMSRSSSFGMPLGWLGQRYLLFSSELCESKEQWTGIVSAIKSAELLSVTSWFFKVVILEFNEFVCCCN